MGFIDSLKKFTESDNGIKSEITLNSPDGKEYSARWIGDPIALEKKLGIFYQPRVPGNVVQDLDVNGDVYQFTVYFDGSAQQTVSKAFWESLKEHGAWSVIHPLLGLKQNMYLRTATWLTEPVRSAEHTEFNLSFIQGLGPQAEATDPKSDVEAFSLDAIQSAIDQFFELINLDNFEAFNALTSAVNKSLNIVKSTLRRVENLQILNPKIEGIISGIGTTIEAFPPDTEQLGAQFASLFEAIGLSQSTSNDAIENFTNYADTLYADGFNSGTGDINNLNSMATFELMVALSNVEIARAALLSGVETRNGAVEQCTNISTYFSDMMTRLDEAQEVFADTRIEDQYVSMSQSFADQYKLAQKSIEYILSNTTNLLIERRFVIATGRSPLEIAWDELGGPGDYITLEDGLTIDQNYENYCRWNGLVDGQEIWIPAGTEQRVFV